MIGSSEGKCDGIVMNVVTTATPVKGSKRLDQRMFIFVNNVILVVNNWQSFKL